MRDGMRIMAAAPARAAAVGAVLAGLLGGCNSVPRAEVDALAAENTDLRERLDSVNSTLAASEQDKDNLLVQLDACEADRADLRAQLESRPSPVAGGAVGNGFTRRASDMVVSIEGDVLFASGSITLKADGRRELDTIARRILSQYPNNTIRVEGYTDGDPIRKSKWETNERLSAERALAVEQYLVSRGIDANQIYSAAMGPADPQATKAQSRRVEIVVLSAG